MHKKLNDLLSTFCQSQRMGATEKTHAGFTLIEMSIVLVVIGLIVGGILVGQTLISAAGVRATISQIEKYDTAANTFREKYGYLPGDIRDPDATSFGFTPRGTHPGEGDGDGIIMGNAGGQSFYCANCLGTGETALFWEDLSKAHLIDATFSTGTPDTPPGGTQSGSKIALYIPPAKLGRGNYIYAFGGGLYNGSTTIANGINYFGLSGVSYISGTNSAYNTALTVSEAYAIDSKIDDGLPQLGRVKAQYLDVGQYVWDWAAGGGTSGVGNTLATLPSATSCYDNGGVAGTQKYSVATNNGAGLNCALSIQMQAGD
jgi:prepilin-type N-terminal cleavage/methylation domain-containing protein